MKTCKICNLDFENHRVYSNHVRWNHKEETYHNKKTCEYCNESLPEYCFDKHVNTCNKNPKNFKYCKQCGKLIERIENDFCSQSCSATYTNQNRTIINKEIVCLNCGKLYNKKYIDNKQWCNTCRKQTWIITAKAKIKTDICVICNKTFEHTNSRTTKTCSKECYSQMMSIILRNNPNCGGETNYKKFRYKGISMDSTWEVIVAEFLDKHNVEWKRDRTIVFTWIDKEGKQRRYYPDFFLPTQNIYIDTKNKYLLIKDRFKLQQVIKEHKINLVYGLLPDVIKELKIKLGV